MSQQPTLLFSRDRSGATAQQPVTTIRGLIDSDHLPLGEVNKRYRDIPHDDPPDDNHAQLPRAARPVPLEHQMRSPQ
jgi:hypothetical protein